MLHIYVEGDFVRTPVGTGLVLKTFGRDNVYVSLSAGGKVWAGPEELTLLKAVG